MTPRYVLDAAALLALFQGEPGGPRVRAILREAERGDATAVLTAVNLGEVLYTFHLRRGREAAAEALGFIDRFPVHLLPADRDLAVRAVRLKAGTGLGYADCFAAAAARREDAVLVTGDEDFRRIAGHVAIEWLPPAASA